MVLAEHLVAIGVRDLCEGTLAPHRLTDAGRIELCAAAALDALV